LILLFQNDRSRAYQHKGILASLWLRSRSVVTEREIDNLARVVLIANDVCRQCVLPLSRDKSPALR